MTADDGADAGDRGSRPGGGEKEDIRVAKMVLLCL